MWLLVYFAYFPHFCLFRYILVNSNNYIHFGYFNPFCLVHFICLCSFCVFHPSSNFHAFQIIFAYFIEFRACFIVFVNFGIFCLLWIVFLYLNIFLKFWFLFMFLYIAWIHTFWFIFLHFGLFSCILVHSSVSNNFCAFFFNFHVLWLDHSFDDRFHAFWYISRI